MDTFGSDYKWHLRIGITLLLFEGTISVLMNNYVYLIILMNYYITRRYQCPYHILVR